MALLNAGTPAFLVGMALFLGAHGCYIAAFTRAGAATALRRPPLLAVPPVWVMATYAAGQALIVTGWAARDRGNQGGAAHSSSNARNRLIRSSATPNPSRRYAPNDPCTRRTSSYAASR